MLKGDKPWTTFSKEGLKNLVAKFDKTTRKRDSIKQITNHWDSIKSNWKIWNKLK